MYVGKLVCTNRWVGRYILVTGVVIIGFIFLQVDDRSIRIEVTIKIIKVRDCSIEFDFEMFHSFGVLRG